jgi:hypothetical protein
MPRRRNPHAILPDRWYGLSIWKRRSASQLRLEPLCAFCREQGRVEPATLADHVEPHKGDWNAFATGELQSLCATCHNRTKREIELHGFHSALGLDGWPRDKNHPANRS